jgi:hypothetical protein
MNDEKNKKSRNWTIIVYPDSAPKDWRGILDNQHIQWIESPLHDKDVNPGTGEIKKAHWHILLVYDGPTTFKNVSSLAAELNSPIPQAIGSAKGLVRYMIHLDNPEKHQYPLDEIVGHCGADVQSYFELSATNKLNVMKEIVEYIYDEKIDNYADFLMIAMQKSDDWFDIAINHNTLAINKLIDGIWQKNKKDNE